MTRLKCIGLALLVVILSGCGRAFLLPGHYESNLSHPPDLVMHVGQREEAIHDGIFWCPLGMVNAPWSRSVIASDDEGIVSFEKAGDRSGSLVARSVGTVRLHYYPGRINNNEGFTVSVLPKKAD